MLLHVPRRPFGTHAYAISARSNCPRSEKAPSAHGGRTGVGTRRLRRLGNTGPEPVLRRSDARASGLVRSFYHRRRRCGRRSPTTTTATVVGNRRVDTVRLEGGRVIGGERPFGPLRAPRASSVVGTSWSGLDYNYRQGDRLGGRGRRGRVGASGPMALAASPARRRRGRVLRFASDDESSFATARPRRPRRAGSSARDTRVWKVMRVLVLQRSCCHLL